MRVLDLGCGDGTTALPEARLGADVLGVDIASNLVDAGNRRARRSGLTNCRFQEGDASHLDDLADDKFDLVVSIFGAMFAPRPSTSPKRWCGSHAGRADRDGQLDPERSDAGRADPQVLRAYSPPPPEGFVSPMTWGVEEQRDRAVRGGWRAL